MDAVALAKGALAFFASNSDVQIDQLDARHPGSAFPDALGGSNSKLDEYAFVVGCVFKTYLGSLLDSLPDADPDSSLGDFNHRLNCFLHDFATEPQSGFEAELLTQLNKLRIDALRASRELDPHTECTLLGLDITRLISFDEFMASEHQDL